MAEFKSLDRMSADSTDYVAILKASSNKIGWAPLSAINGKGYCGRRWSFANASPLGEAVGNIDKLANLVDVLGIGCYMVKNNHTRRKLSKTNHYAYTDSSSAKLDGSDGHYQWGTGVPCYVSIWDDENYHYEAIDIEPIKGHWNYYIPVQSQSATLATIDRTNGNLVSYINTAAQYRGGNNNAALDSAYNSQLGYPVSYMTAAQYGAAARLNGNHWDANWYAHNFFAGLLSRIILGSRSTQYAFSSVKDSNGLYNCGLGYGPDAANHWSDINFLHYPYLKTNAGISLADALGVTSETITLADGTTQTINNISSFFGLRLKYHYLWLAQRGMLLRNNADLTATCFVQPKLNDVNFIDTSVNGLTEISSIYSADDSWHYIKSINSQYLSGFPTDITGTESTYYGDAYVKDKGTGLRVPLAGGVAYSGGIVGFCCLYGNIAVGWSLAYGGASLCECAEDWDTTPFFAN